MKRTRWAVVLMALLGARGAAAAWPQWGGPGRDFKATVSRIAWPPSGPRELWSRPLGEGYSAIVTDGQVLYTMYRPVKGVLAAMMERFRGTATAPEGIVAIDAGSGRTLWEHVYEAPARERMNLEYGPGPHSTPLIAGDRLFAVGSTGKMHALDRRTGRVLWAHDLWGGLGGTVQGRGYTCSPIAYEQNVIVTLGGPGQALVAFDQATGRVAWKGGSLDLSPSSPILAKVDGQDQLILFHADGIAGADPRGGAVYWTHPHATDYGLNISTPLWGEDNVLFLSSAYSGGSKGLRLSQSGGKTTVTPLWDSRRMRVHFGTAVRLGDRVYGSSGDFGPAVMTAIDVRSGQVAWQERGFARASVVGAGGKLLLVDEDGTLALATPGPAGLSVEGRAEVLEAKAWTAPTVAGTRVYLRDRVSIKALELS